MRILLISALLALTVANVTTSDRSQNEGAQKPGMCFEEFFKKHHDEFKKTKSTNETSNPLSHQHDQTQQKIDGAHPNPDGPSSWSSKPHPDFSKFKGCSVDWDCDDADKCCHTKSGMKCTRPMFEGHHKGANPEVHTPAEFGSKHKRDASDEDEDEVWLQLEVIKEMVDGNEDEEVHEKGRVKRSKKENGHGKGTKEGGGNGNDSGKKKGKDKGKGKGKGGGSDKKAKRG